MFAPISIGQFTLARSWLATKKKTTGITKRGTSYGLKHVAEHDIGYVTNGIFIAAAIAEGFQVQRAGGSPSAWFNISVKAWRQ